MAHKIAKWRWESSWHEGQKQMKKENGGVEIKKTDVSGDYSEKPSLRSGGFMVQADDDNTFNFVADQLRIPSMRIINGYYDA